MKERFSKLIKPKSITVPVIIIIVLLLLLLISFIINWEVISNLREEYDIIFKGIALLLVIVGIALTLKRMRQTADQIYERQ